MKKIMILNGSPRKNGNTSTLAFKRTAYDSDKPFISCHENK